MLVIIDNTSLNSGYLNESVLQEVLSLVGPTWLHRWPDRCALTYHEAAGRGSLPRNWLQFFQLNVDDVQDMSYLVILLEHFQNFIPQENTIERYQVNVSETQQSAYNSSLLGVFHQVTCISF